MLVADDNGYIDGCDTYQKIDVTDTKRRPWEQFTEL